jgi:hypothetical protein
MHGAFVTLAMTLEITGEWTLDGEVVKAFSVRAILVRAFSVRAFSVGLFSVRAFSVR